MMLSAQSPRVISLHYKPAVKRLRSQEVKNINQLTGCLPQNKRDRVNF